MVREASPYQLDLGAHPFGVAVEKFGRHALRRSKYPAQRAGQF
jgi:hypothetical protein